MPFFVRNRQSGLKGYITVLYRHRSSQDCRVLVNALTDRLKPVIHETELGYGFLFVEVVVSHFMYSGWDFMY